MAFEVSCRHRLSEVWNLETSVANTSNGGLGGLATFSFSGSGVASIGEFDGVSQAKPTEPFYLQISKLPYYLTVWVVALGHFNLYLLRACTVLPSNDTRH